MNKYYLHCIFTLFFTISIFSYGKNPNVLPNSVKLSDVQEIAWVQESHRTRIGEIIKLLVNDPEFVEGLTNKYNLKNLGNNNIKNFLEVSVFRTSVGHDLVKGDFESAIGLQKIYGKDTSKLPPIQKAQANQIVYNLNNRYKFLEDDLYREVLERDKNGIKLNDAQLKISTKLSNISERFEKIMDWMDRSEYGGKEWGKVKCDSTEVFLTTKINNSWKDTSLFNPKNWKEYKKLIEAREMDRFVMKHIERLGGYSKLTKHLSVDKYLAQRRLYPALSFHDFKTKVLGLDSVKLPGFLPKVLNSSAQFDPVSAKAIEADIKKFTAEVDTKSIPSSSQLKLISRGTMKAVKFAGKVATPIALTTGAYTFVKTGDLGEAVADMTGIAQAGDKNEFDLINDKDLKWFFDLSHKRQLDLIQRDDRMKLWFRGQFMSQSLLNQKSLLCKDSSLRKLFSIPCIKQVKCANNAPSNFVIESDNVTQSGVKSIEWTYIEDPIRGKDKLDSYKIVNKDNSYKSIQLFSKAKTKLTQSENGLKKWLLYHQLGFERACKYSNKNTEAKLILNPQFQSTEIGLESEIPSNQTESSENLALNQFLIGLNDSYHERESQLAASGTSDSEFNTKSVEDEEGIL